MKLVDYDFDIGPTVRRLAAEVAALAERLAEIEARLAAAERALSAQASSAAAPTVGRRRKGEGE